MLRFSNPLETQVTITVEPWQYSAAEATDGAGGEDCVKDQVAKPPAAGSPLCYY